MGLLVNSKGMTHMTGARGNAGREVPASGELAVGRAVLPKVPLLSCASHLILTRTFQRTNCWPRLRRRRQTEGEGFPEVLGQLEGVGGFEGGHRTMQPCLSAPVVVCPAQESGEGTRASRGGRGEVRP